MTSKVVYTTWNMASGGSLPLHVKMTMPYKQRLSWNLYQIYKILSEYAIGTWSIDVLLLLGCPGGKGGTDAQPGARVPVQC